MTKKEWIFYIFPTTNDKSAEDLGEGGAEVKKVEG